MNLMPTNPFSTSLPVAVTTGFQKLPLLQRFPKGLRPPAQGCPMIRGYLGFTFRNGNNLNEVVAVGARMKMDWPQPRCGWEFSRTMTQGSSCLATPGFGTESRWDSKTVFNPQPPQDITGH
jgi:hypothetical protein